jgi:hypothetical protein
MTMTASDVSRKRTIDCMRPSNIMDRKAGKQIGRVTTYTKPGSIAGTTGIAGGMSTTASGAPDVIGTIGTTIEMTADSQ